VSSSGEGLRISHEEVKSGSTIVSPVERSRYATNVEFEPSLNDVVNAAAGKRIYARIEANWDPSRSSGAMPGRSTPSHM